MTPNEAKKLVAAALDKRGIFYVKLRAKTRSFEGLGYGSAIFVTPVGAKVPDPKLREAKEEMKGSGVILDLPQICDPNGMTIE